MSRGRVGATLRCWLVLLALGSVPTLVTPLPGRSAPLTTASDRSEHIHIGVYVLDFFCPAAKLAIEVDGIAHDMGDRPRRDEIRAAWLAEQGIELLRLPAKDVLADPDAIADAVLRLCADRAKPLHHPASPDGPPPHGSAAGRSD